ncbi:MAG: hypothetical protein GY806_09175 [Gammaproteobacteria bacterium]|nr:hypothetical protein [Gammaproteobacteria bacterium]
MKKLLIAFVFLVTTLVLVVVFAVVETSADVYAVDQVESRNTRHAKVLARHIWQTLNSDQAQRVISLDAEQLSSLLALFSHSVPGAHFRLNDIGNGWIITGSIKLPEIFRQLYINTSTHLQQGMSSAYLGETRIGSLSLNNQWLLQAAVYFINLTGRTSTSIDAEKLIQKVQLTDGDLVINVHPEFDLQQLKASVKSSSKVALKQITGNQDISNQINHYLDLLNHLSSLTSGLSKLPIPLTDYIPSLFDAVAKKSTVSSAIDENRYALLALIYFSSDFPMRRVIKTALAPSISDVVNRPRILLKQRKDLVLHLMYSAAIELLSDNASSFSIGEIKEISDSNQGGSGFSFVDLMADKAGIYLVQQLTSSASQAKQIQARLSQPLTEQDFFPDISGLPEKLSEADFKQQFHNRQSQQYLAMLKNIDTRIAGLAIYR